MSSAPYWIDVEPITPESIQDSETDSVTSDFQDSGIFSGTEDVGDRSLGSTPPLSREGLGTAFAPTTDRYFTSLARPLYLATATVPLSWSLADNTTTLTKSVRESDVPTYTRPESLGKVAASVVHDAASILRCSSALLIRDQLQSSKYLSTSLNKTPLLIRRSPSFSNCQLGARIRTKALRKQAKPLRSPNSRDPNFRGVILKFRLRFLRRRQYRLLIRAKFCCSRRTVRCRYHKHESLQLVGETSSSDSDQEIQATMRWHCREGKQCASCSTRKTPLWRDAEDGTPLCNACGIRYKKYRIRCVGCWYVPRKANKSYPICLSCGDRIQHTYQIRRATFMDRL